MDLGLKDKVVLVTGSSRGIGRSIALAFAQEGAKVVVTGRNIQDVEKTVQEIDQVSGKGWAYGFPCDLGRPEQVKACVEKIGRAHV